MKAIILTDKEANNVESLIEEYFKGTHYGSFRDFTIIEKRSIVILPLKNGLNRLSVTVLSDPFYSDLKDFVLKGMNGTPLIREVNPDELPSET